MQVFTQRFLHVEGNTAVAVTETYQVPEGKRAVVTSVVSTNTSGSTQWVWVALHGAYVWAHHYLASEAFMQATMRQVAYERETIVGFSAATGLHLIVSGFLFDDPIGKPPETKPGFGDGPELPRPAPWTPPS